MVDPTRPKESYSFEDSSVFADDFAEQIVPEIIKIIFTLPNVRRAPNASGICASFDITELGAQTKLFVTNTGSVSPWPGSLFLIVCFVRMVMVTPLSQLTFSCSMTIEAFYRHVSLMASIYTMFVYFNVAQVTTTMLNLQWKLLR